MDKLVKRIVNATTLALAAVATITGLYVAFKGEDFARKSATLDASFYITYILFFVILAMLAFFVIMQVFSSKKTMISTFVLLVIAAIIALFSYIFADKELSKVALDLDISESIYRLAGTLLNFAYIVFFGVILAFLGSFVYTKIKK
jgi:cytochrome c biogenesis factor